MFAESLFTKIFHFTIYKITIFYMRGHSWEMTWVSLLTTNCCFAVLSLLCVTPSCDECCWYYCRLMKQQPVIGPSGVPSMYLEIDYSSLNGSRIKSWQIMTKWPKNMNTNWRSKLEVKMFLTCTKTSIFDREVTKPCIITIPLPWSWYLIWILSAICLLQSTTKLLKSTTMLMQ